MIVSMYSYLIPVVLCIAQIIGTTSMGWANRRSLFSLPHAHLNNYSDHRRLMVRPLMHLGLSMPVGAEVEGYPLLYITSAFLGRSAVLRTILVARLHKAKPPEKQQDYPDIFSWPIHCLWTMGLKGTNEHSQLQHSQLHPTIQGYIRPGFAAHTYIGTCETDVSEISMRTGKPVPRFVTIIRDPNNAGHIESLSWVHVSVVPIVAEDSNQVQQHYSWGKDNRGGESGPFLTPKMHEDGDGQVAVCTSTPLVSSDDHHAGYLPQWLSFQKIVGVSKVFVYLLDPGPIEVKIFEHYAQQQHGLVEIWNFRLSRYLMKKEYLNNPFACGNSGSYNAASVLEHGGGHWLNCTKLGSIDLYWWGQLANTAHCHYSTMGRYRWAVFLDFDEWLVPKMHPAVGYTAMLKQIMAKPVGLLDSSEKNANPPGFGQDRASWPVSFM